MTPFVDGYLLNAGLNFQLQYKRKNVFPRLTTVTVITTSRKGSSFVPFRPAAFCVPPSQPSYNVYFLDDHILRNKYYNFLLHRDPIGLLCNHFYIFKNSPILSSRSCFLFQKELLVFFMVRKIAFQVQNKACFPVLRETKGGIEVGCANLLCLVNSSG